MAKSETHSASAQEVRQVMEYQDAECRRDPHTGEVRWLIHLTCSDEAGWYAKVPPSWLHALTAGWMYTLVSQWLSCTEECVCKVFNYLCKLAVGVCLIREDYFYETWPHTSKPQSCWQKSRPKSKWELTTLASFSFGKGRICGEWTFHIASSDDLC